MLDPFRHGDLPRIPGAALFEAGAGQADHVREENYDVALHVGTLPGNAAAHRHLVSLTRGLYASPDYLRRGRRPEAWQFILTGQQVADGISALAMGPGAPDRRARVLTNNIGLVRQLVLCGAGVGVLPNGMCGQDVRSGRLRRLPEREGFPPLEVSATPFSGRAMTRKVGAFLDHLGECLAAEDPPLIGRAPR
ncbi:LysR substrate-binding domain-containing protein [Roseomonas chloroacetimidivorans]|uniref:LysR substrate-binding domain-containing protein n=1 Tax=Roseomonas chloroacetimidivorans TaxID=1766656 RepID=UPI003C7722C0